MASIYDAAASYDALGCSLEESDALMLSVASGVWTKSLVVSSTFNDRWVILLFVPRRASNFGLRSLFNLPYRFGDDDADLEKWGIIDLGSMAPATEETDPPTYALHPSVVYDTHSLYLLEYRCISFDINKTVEVRMNRIVSQLPSVTPVAIVQLFNDDRVAPGFQLVDVDELHRLGQEALIEDYMDVKYEGEQPSLHGWSI